MDLLSATGRFRPCDLSEVLRAVEDGAYEFPWGCCYQLFDPVPEGDFFYAGGSPTILNGFYVGNGPRFVGRPDRSFAADDGLYAVLFPNGVTVRDGDRDVAWKRPCGLAVARDTTNGGRIVRRSPRPLYFTPRR